MTPGMSTTIVLGLERGDDAREAVATQRTGRVLGQARTPCGSTSEQLAAEQNMDELWEARRPVRRTSALARALLLRSRGGPRSALDWPGLRAPWLIYSDGRPLCPSLHLSRRPAAAGSSTGRSTGEPSAPFGATTVSSFFPPGPCPSSSRTGRTRARVYRAVRDPPQLQGTGADTGSPRHRDGRLEAARTYLDVRTVRTARDLVGKKLGTSASDTSSRRSCRPPLSPAGSEAPPAPTQFVVFRPAPPVELCMFDTAASVVGLGVLRRATLRDHRKPRAFAGALQPGVTLGDERPRYYPRALGAARSSMPRPD